MILSNPPQIYYKLMSYCCRGVTAQFSLKKPNDPSSLYTIKELLDHSTIKTTEIYAYLADEYKTDMASKLPY